MGLLRVKEWGLCVVPLGPGSCCSAEGLGQTCPAGLEGVTHGCKTLTNRLCHY